MRTLFAGAWCSAAAIAIGWIFTQRLFFRFRGRNPNTWRTSTKRRVAAGILLNDVLFGFAFAGFFHLVGGIGVFNIENWEGQGITFGLGCWAAVALPMCLQMLVFVRVHQGVIIGMLLDWLVSSVAAGLICSYLLGR